MASSLIPSPLSHQRSLQSAFPRGEATGLLRSSLRSLRSKSCLWAGGASSATGDIATPVPGHVPFWSKPDSIFGLPLFTAFISTSPGLTSSGLLAPDRRDASSRRVGSRVHDRSEDRGYVVPQASDLAVAGDARWGSRPMAEHRVMSEDLLGKRITDREDATNRTQWNRKPAQGVCTNLFAGFLRSSRSARVTLPLRDRCQIGSRRERFTQTQQNRRFQGRRSLPIRLYHNCQSGRCGRAGLGFVGAVRGGGPTSRPRSIRGMTPPSTVRSGGPGGDMRRRRGSTRGGRPGGQAGWHRVRPAPTPGRSQ